MDIKNKDLLNINRNKKAHTCSETRVCLPGPFSFEIIEVIMNSELLKKSSLGLCWISTTSSTAMGCKSNSVASFLMIGSLNPVKHSLTLLSSLFSSFLLFLSAAFFSTCFDFHAFSRFCRFFSILLHHSLPRVLMVGISVQCDTNHQR